MSAVVDQADGLRRLLRPRGSRIIAIAGVADGMGATTAAMNLSVELARQGDQKVVLLDEHWREGDCACSRWPAVTVGALRDAASGRADVAGAVMPGCAGVQVLPAPSGVPLDSFNPRALCSQGLIVVDVAFDSAGQLSPLARMADELVIVMRPVASSITLTYLGLKRLQYTHAQQTFKFLVNAVDSANQARQVIGNVLNTSSRFLAVSLQPLGWISSDPMVGEAQRERKTVCEAYPASSAASDFRRIAAAIARGHAPAPVEGRAKGLPAAMPVGAMA